MAVMNMALKARIIFMFGSQSNFCEAVGEREPVVSRVINGRDEIDLKRKKLWARKLKSTVAELFD